MSFGIDRRRQCRCEGCDARHELLHKAAAYRAAADPGLAQFAAVLAGLAADLPCTAPPPGSAPGLRAA